MPTVVLTLALIAVFASPRNSWLPQGSAPVQAEADRTQPPPEFTAAVTVSAKGVQIYRCEPKGAGAAGWVFVAPEATLYAGGEPGGGEVVGMHGAGPTWRWKDGSALVGKVLVKQDAPEPNAIPWLLLSATAAPGSSAPGSSALGSSAMGSSAAGQLVRISYVRRTETHAGSEPATGCDAGHIGTEARVPYTAKYTFYRRGR